MDAALSDSITNLLSSSPSTVFNALVQIRTKYLKTTNCNSIETFRNLGGIKNLIQIVQKPTSKKILDICLSTLANCCMQQQIRLEVRKLSGIQSIRSILKKVQVDTIQNRACRALANLALDVENAEDILVNTDLLECVVHLLSKTENAECKQTYVRFIRILGSNLSHRVAVCKADGLKAIALLLSGSDSKLLEAVTRTIAEFTKGCGMECIQQILEAETLQLLVQLACHNDSKIRCYSLEALLNICQQPHARPPLGAAGVIQFFISHIKNTKEPIRDKAVVNALCLCCRDSVNRIRIRENGGLNLLLQLLSSEDYLQSHTQIICSLTCFLYDDLSLDVLLKEGMVDCLLEQLNKGADSVLEEVDSESDTEIYSDTGQLENSDQGCIKNISKASQKMTECHNNSDAAVKENNNGPKNKKPKDRFKFLRVEEGVSDAPAVQTAAVDTKETTEKLSGEPKENDNNPAEPIKERASDGSSVPLPRAHSMPALSSAHHSEQEQVHSNNFRPLSPTLSHNSSWAIAPSPPPPSQHVPWVRSPSPPTPYAASSSMSPMSYLSPEWSPEYSGSSWGGWDTPRYSPQHIASPGYSGYQSPLSPGSGYSPGVYSHTTDVMPQWSPVHIPEEWSPQDLDVGPSVAAFPALFPELQYAQYSTTEGENKLDDDIVMEADQMDVPLVDANEIHDIGNEHEVESFQTNLCEDQNSQQATSSSVNLEELLASTSTKKMATVEVNPSKTTENNILILLSRVSQMPDPSTYLCTPHALQGMFRYALTVHTPNARWFRICSRLTKNTFCFEAFMLMSGAAFIHEYLIKQKYRPVTYSSTFSKNENSKAESSRQGSEREDVHDIKIVIEKSLDTTVVESKFEEDCTRPSTQVADDKTHPSNQCEESNTCSSNQLEGDSTLSFKQVEGDHSLSTNQMDTCNTFISLEAEGGKTQTSSQQVTGNTTEKTLRDIQLVNFGKSLHQDLTLQAETPYGQGVICHILLKKFSPEKLNCAIDLPHICNNKKLRTKFILDHRGLSYLLDAIEAHCDDPSMYPMAIESLCVLAKQVCPRFRSSSLLSVMESEGCLHGRTVSQHNMRFTLTKDQTVLSAERSKVSGASTIFTAMLEGHYLESRKDNVSISEASGPAFRYLLHYLHGCGSGCEVIAGSSIPEDAALEVDLETLSLSDRYILPTLQTQIATIIAQKHWNASQIVHIYRYATMHNCYGLAKDCLKFMLVGELKWSERLSVLIEVFSGPDRDQVRKDFGQLLVEFF